MKLFTAISLSLISFSPMASSWSLLDLIDATIEHNPLIQAAYSETRAAEANLKAVKANYLPQIDFVAEYTNNDAKFEQDGESFATRDNLSSIALSFAQAIYDKTKLEKISKEEKQLAFAALNHSVIEQGLILDVVTAYLNLLRSRDNLVFVEKQFDAFTSQLSRAQERYAVGVSTQNDVLEVTADLDNAQAELILAQNQIDTRLQELVFKTGIDIFDVEPLNVSAITALNIRSVQADTMFNLAVGNNPDLKLTQLSLDMSKDDISIASARRYPTLELIAGYTESDIQQLTVFTENTSYYGLSLKIPIYQGGRLTSLESSARENFIAQSLHFKNQTNEVKKLIIVTVNTLKSVASRITAFERLQQSAGEALRATEAGFEVGTRTVLDVLDATSNVHKVNAQLSGVRYDYIVNALNLEYLTGNLNRQQIKTFLTTIRPITRS